MSNFGGRNASVFVAIVPVHECACSLAGVGHSCVGVLLRDLLKSEFPVSVDVYVLHHYACDIVLELRFHACFFSLSQGRVELEEVLVRYHAKLPVSRHLELIFLLNAYLVEHVYEELFVGLDACRTRYTQLGIDVHLIRLLHLCLLQHGSQVVVVCLDDLVVDFHDVSPDELV